MLVDMLDAGVGDVLLDLGCGEGQGMRAITGAHVIGCDLSIDLLRVAKDAGPVVQARLPRLDWLRAGVVDGVFVMLVIEHLEDPGPLFEEASRVTRPGGVLVVVTNHPLMTAPGSSPIIDPQDGEVLWRWGNYFQGGYTEEPQGDGIVRFYHRSLSELLNMAADAGWRLDRMTEAALLTDDPLLALQSEVPRLAAIRWQKPSGP